MPQVTIFSTHKPKADGVKRLAQDNSLRSWCAAGFQVCLFGAECSIATAALPPSAKVHIEPEVERTPQGLPTIRSMFARVQQVMPADLYVFVNADILLDRMLNTAADLLLKLKARPFLAVCRRRDVRLDVDVPYLAFEQASTLEHALRAYAPHSGRLHAGGSDLFAFPHGATWVSMPELAVGHPGWDNWVMWDALNRSWPMVNLTPSLVIVHQDHVRGYGQQQTKHNLELTGAKMATVSKSTHWMRDWAIEPTPRRRFIEWPVPASAVCVFKLDPMRDTPFGISASDNARSCAGAVPSLRSLGLVEVERVEQAQVLLASAVPGQPGGIGVRSGKRLQGKPILVWNQHPERCAEVRSVLPKPDGFDCGTIRCMTACTGDVFLDPLWCIDSLGNEVPKLWRADPRAKLLAFCGTAHALPTRPRPTKLEATRLAVITEARRRGVLALHGAGWKHIAHQRLTAAERVKFYASSRFVLCLERFALPNYVTERLWESLQALALPVFYGHRTGIERLLPKRSYVELAGLTPHQLLDQLAAMSNDEYLDRFNRCVAAANTAYLALQRRGSVRQAARQSAILKAVQTIQLLANGG